MVNTDELLSKAAPPETVAYQSIVSPVPGVAESVTVPGPQTALPGTDGADGERFIAAVTPVLDAAIQPVVVFLDSA